MGRFDFISDEEFRNSLDSDAIEVHRCMQAKAWKAVHVLVGSMIECLLMDYLYTIGLKGNTREHLLKMDLNQLIELCAGERILSQKTVDLCSVVRTYRNLIHPGRLLRLRENVDAKSATVAEALLQIVTDEIAAIKTAQCGFTAEQIVAKVERDPSAMAILHHLLKETGEPERKRLLLKVLPSRYYELDADPSLPSEAVLGRLSSCFRSAFEASTKETKSRVTKEFVSILKQEAQNRVYVWETEFFRAWDMEHLDPPEIAMVRDHLLSRLASGATDRLLDAMLGLGSFLGVQDVSRIVDPLIRVIVNDDKPDTLKVNAQALLYDTWGNAPQEVSEKIVVRLDKWVERFTSKGLQVEAETVQRCKGLFEVEPPF